MDASSALSIVNGTSKNISENSTLSEEEMLRQLGFALKLMNLIQSRLTFVTALLNEGQQARRRNMHITMDVTHITNNYKAKLIELLSAVENLQIKTAGLKAIVSNSVARQLLSLQEQNSLMWSPVNTKDLSEDILDAASQLARATDQLKSIYQTQQNELMNFLDRQNLYIEVIAEVNQKIQQLDSFHQYSEQLKKNKTHIAHTKIARAIINSLLSDDINFEENPDLLALKEKWRPALKE